MDKYLLQIIKEISKETGIPIYKVELVVMSEFQFLRKTIQEGTFESIRLMHLGRFKVSKFQKKYGLDKKLRDDANSKNTV